MADESNKPNTNQQPAGRQEEAREQRSLTHNDILSDDMLHLLGVPQPAVSSELGNGGSVSGAVALQFDELLSSIDNHPSLAGGILTFDSDSSPGHTIVRVMLDDSGSQQAFEVGVFNGVGMDLNSLLGLIASQNGDPS